MDVTKFNQLIALEDFAKELSRCDYCAIDQEMTGVDVPGATPPMGASQEEVYYAKRVAVEAYNAFQMGIALFTKVDGNFYEVRPYNFYLLNSTGDLRLSLSAISFLASNNMNFQTWLTSGMNYCNELQEKAFEAADTLSFTGETEKRVADEFTAAVEECLASDGEPLFMELSCTTDLAHRLKFYAERYSDYQVSAVYDGRPNLAQKIKFQLKKLNAAEWMNKKEQKKLQQERKRAEVLGFRQFWKVLVDSKKPIVGHNFMHDVMFMLHMHQEALPHEYSAFKQQLHKYFPEIYDTKTIVTNLTGDLSFQLTHLEAVYRECRRRGGLSPDTFPCKFRLPPGFYNYNDQVIKTQNKAHEAAYDAYMTGVAFCILRDLYGDVTTRTKNVISAFGSVYYMCVDTSDQLVNNNTFVLESDVPCFCEDIKSLFYLTEEGVTLCPTSDEVDKQNLSFSVNGLKVQGGTRNFTSFCVRLKNETSAEQVHERLKKIRQKTFGDGEHANVELLSHITVRNI